MHSSSFHFLVLLLGVSSVLGTGSMSDTVSCGLLPRRMSVGLPPHPPALVDPCSEMDCPSAPNQCHYDSLCSVGLCLPPQQKAAGTTCDDGDSYTSNDICVQGTCAGFSMQCPNDIRVKESSIVQVTWADPIVNYHHFPVTLSSNYDSGDYFGIGVTNVEYEARINGPNGVVVETCSFTVEVVDPCDGVVCGPLDECHDIGVCIDGVCTNPISADGIYCGSTRNDVCISGVCQDPCDGVDCPPADDCQLPGTCEVQGINPVCIPGGPRDNGVYDRYYAMPTTSDPYHGPSLSGMDERVTCYNGKAVCDSPLRLLPRRLGALPPNPPEFDDDACSEVTCPSAPNQCHYDSVCDHGLCLTPEWKPAGTSCDDGDANTHDDICVSGVCSGIVLECPANINLYPDTGSMWPVEWNEPTVSYHGIHLSISSTHSSGDMFPVGYTDVEYYVSGRDPSGRTVRATCMFTVYIEDPCTGVVCGAQDECHEAGVCSEGLCTNPTKADGDSCSTGVCITGICEDPCRGVDCVAEDDCHYPGHCEIIGTVGVCSPGEPKPNGLQHREFAIPTEAMTSGHGMSLSGLDELATCWQGQSVCDPPLRFLPRHPLSLPPHPPEFDSRRRREIAQQAAIVPEITLTARELHVAEEDHQVEDTQVVLEPVAAQGAHTRLRAAVVDMEARAQRQTESTSESASPDTSSLSWIVVLACLAGVAAVGAAIKIRVSNSKAEESKALPQFVKECNKDTNPVDVAVVADHAGLE